MFSMQEKCYKNYKLNVRIQEKYMYYRLKCMMCKRNRIMCIKGTYSPILDRYNNYLFIQLKGGKGSTDGVYWGH